MKRGLNIIFPLFLLLYFLINLNEIKRYGIPIDDYTQYVVGEHNYQVLTGERKIKDIDSGIKYYGPIFETSLFFIDNQFEVEPEPDVKWHIRHGMVLWLFVLACYTFYVIVSNLFDSKLVGITVSIMLLFNPRLFADMHYNSKDTVSLSMFTFAILFYYRYFISRNNYYLILAAIITGIAATLRITAFFVIPAFTIIELLYNYKSKMGKIILLYKLGLFCLFILVSFVLFMPSLWTNPIAEISTLVQHITKFPWPNSTLVAGKWVGPGAMPFWYFPVWFFITTPIVFIILFIISLFIYIFNRKYRDNHFLLFISLILSITLLYIITTRPNLYDSWRQLQFIAVLFFFILAISIDYLFSYIRSRWGKISFFLLFGSYSIWSCLSIHPYQYVYFNEYYRCFGKRHTYDQDYWNVSVAPCLRWLKEHDNRSEISVYINQSNSIWLNNFFFSKGCNTKFIEANSRDSADYEIEPIRNNKYFDSTKNVIYSIVPIKDTIARIIKLRPSD